LDGIDPYAVPNEALGSFKGARTIFYTTGVINTPGQIGYEIHRLRSLLQSLAREPLRREAADKLKQINIRDAKHAEEIFVTHDWISGPAPKLKPTYGAVTEKYIAKEKRIGDPSRLILVDEADRLKMISLEQMRAIFDAGGVGLVLIGMPGIEKRMARYPQFYSRIGFVHEFRPLNVSEMRRLLTSAKIIASRILLMRVSSIRSRAKSCAQVAPVPRTILRSWVLVTLAQTLHRQTTPFP
jgi:hypothetical protein